MAKTNDDSTKREELLKVANQVRPALASQPYIPALTHICFDGEMATAYNDVVAISVACDLDVERCIPGEFLIRALGSFNGETVALNYGKEGVLVISSGRSRLKVPTLTNDAFPLRLPSTDDAHTTIKLTDDILAGVKACLISVGNDPTKPAAMGVTLDADDKGLAVLFSTDNHTISRYQAGDKVKLPGDTPIFMPTFFCEHVVRLAASFDKDVAMEVHDGALVARIGKAAIVFTKTLADVETLDFMKVISRSCDFDKLTEDLFEIPAGFDEALGRALLVLTTEQDKSTQLTVHDDELQLHSESEYGHADDTFRKIDAADSQRYVNPSDLARAGRVCTHMALLKSAVVMSDLKSFTHLISHVEAPKSKQ